MAYYENLSPNCWNATNFGEKVAQKAFERQKAIIMYFAELILKALLIMNAIAGMPGNSLILIVVAFFYCNAVLVMGYRTCDDHLRTGFATQLKNQQTLPLLIEIWCLPFSVQFTTYNSNQFTDSDDVMAEGELVANEPWRLTLWRSAKSCFVWHRP